MNEANGNARLARTLLKVALALDGFMLFFTLCSAVNNNGGLAVMLLLALAVMTVLALWYATKQGYWFVRQIERTWKQTCTGIGFIGEARSFRNGLKGAYLDGETKTIYPQLKNVCGNWQEWTAEIRFFDGQTIDDYNKHAAAFVLAFGVPFVSFDLAESGLISVRAGQIPIPAAYNFQQQHIWDSTQN